MTAGQWLHSTHQAFYEYYRDESLTERAFERFKSIRRTVLDALSRERGVNDLQSLDVADIGCGAGTQCILWSELGHRTNGLDVNEPLLKLARDRAHKAGVAAQFQVGSATELPWEDSSMDVCLLPELLEHVPEWQKVLDEASRILKPGGILFLTTTNKLCPLQGEFRLPMYSWYPGPVKRYCERLAMTTRPALANYATYPAVNWFTYFQLRRELALRGLDSKDKFDTMVTADFNAMKAALIFAIRRFSLLKWAALVALPYSCVIAIKRT